MLRMRSLWEPRAEEVPRVVPRAALSDSSSLTPREVPRLSARAMPSATPRERACWTENASDSLSVSDQFSELPVEYVSLPLSLSDQFFELPVDWLSPLS